jgi:putative acetyltransferase
MTLVIREMRDNDARAFLEVHHAAVRRLAARDYPAEIIEAWAPLPITSAAVEAVTANPENEIRFVADSDGRLIGLTCLVIAKNELRACYVAPDVVRTGVGRALLMKIEETARNAGVKCLHTVSSVTAEPFYRSQGYRVTDYGNRLLNGRWSMACVRMSKAI